jgi:hypothetical protein
MKQAMMDSIMREFWTIFNQDWYLRHRHVLVPLLHPLHSQALLPEERLIQQRESADDKTEMETLGIKASTMINTLADHRDLSLKPDSR